MNGSDDIVIRLVQDLGQTFLDAIRHVQDNAEREIRIGTDLKTLVNNNYMNGYVAGLNAAWAIVDAGVKTAVEAIEKQTKD